MGEGMGGLHCVLSEGPCLQLVLVDELGVTLEHIETFKQALREVLDSIRLEVSNHHLLILFTFITLAVSLALTSAFVPLKLGQTHRLVAVLALKLELL